MFDTNSIDYSGKFGDSFVEGVSWNFLGNGSFRIDILVSLFDFFISIFRKSEIEQLKYYKPNLGLFLLRECESGNLEYEFTQESKNGLENNTVLRRLMILFALVFSVLIIFIDSSTNTRSNPGDFGIIFWVMIFIWLPFYILYYLRITYKRLLLQKLLNYKIVFNKNGEYFFKGAINNPFEENINKNYFNTIYAVQVLEKIIRGKENNFYYYEINLVLKDKTRRSVIEASGEYNLIIIKNNAKKIGEFLGVPVWDVTGI